MGPSHLDPPSIFTLSPPILSFDLSAMLPLPPRESYPDFSGKCHLSPPGDRTSNLKPDPPSVPAAKKIPLNHHESIPLALYIPSPPSGFLRTPSPLQSQSRRVVCVERGGEIILCICGSQLLRPPAFSTKLSNQQFLSLVLWNNTAREIFSNIYKRGHLSKAVNCFRDAELRSSLLVNVVFSSEVLFLADFGFLDSCRGLVIAPLFPLHSLHRH